MTAEHEYIVCKCHVSVAEGTTNWKNEDNILYQYVFV